MFSLSVIMPVFSYNGVANLKNVFANLTNAIGESNASSVEIIVLDNVTHRKEDADYLKLLEANKVIKIVPWRYIYRPAKMLNYGAGMAKNDVLCFLHSDSTVSKKYFVNVFKAITNYDGNLGIIGPVINEFNNKDVYGYSFDHRRDLVSIGRMDDGVNKVDAIKWNGMVVSVDDFNSLGGFNDKFINSYFDIDCVQIIKILILQCFRL